MNLCIDQGNSTTKVGVFNQNELIEDFQFSVFSENEITLLFEKYPIKNCILSSVIIEYESVNQLLEKKVNCFLKLTHKTSIPIQNLYKTPETLGKDRLAAIIGAEFLKPQVDILVIDAGTAITFDFIDSKGFYIGGNIAPGLNMRLRALHEFTQKLPLVEAKTESLFLGNDTNSAILSGALYGIVFEIDGYINTLKIKYPQLSIFLTGGSTFYFDNKLKNAIFAEKNLVLIGLNRILQYNVQK
jgi:type III pantothenate kinase